MPTEDSYCDTCQTLAVVCLDESHPKAYLKQDETLYESDITIEPRCEICEARGCTIALHSKIEIELKAFCRRTIFTTNNNDGMTSHIPRQKSPNGLF